MKKILITGGAGFVGRYFTKYFLDQKYEVHVVDNIAQYTGGREPSNWPLFMPQDYKNFIFYQQDCRDWFISNLKDDFDYVLHLAAMVGGRMMIEKNPIAVGDDLSIDSHFWQWAVKSKPKKILTFSSSACYPVILQKKENYKLLSEDLVSFDQPIGVPDLTYGWAKLTSEYLGKIAYENYGIKSVVYRPFSGYGKDQDLSYPFPSICKRILSNKNSKKIQVWGTGDQMRDFIHIEDCIKGVVSTMDKIDDGSPINLSTGKLTSFKEFVKTGCNILGFETEVVGTSDKPEGVFARGGDTKLQHDLGFVTEINLKSGIEEAFTFFEKNN